VVIAVSLAHVVADPTVVGDWTTALTTQHGDPLMIVALSVLVCWGRCVLPPPVGDPELPSRPRL
jgi:hypothetical protein